MEKYTIINSIDLATRMSFRYLYDKKIPNSTIDFMKQLIDYFPFRIHSIQIDNGTEFTYRKHSFGIEHPLDIFCKKNHIKRVYSSVASPLYNCVVESTHN